MTMLKSQREIFGMLLFMTTLCIVLQIKLSVRLLDRLLVFEAPAFPSLFNDSVVQISPYGDDEEHINRLLTLCHTGDALMITAQYHVSGDTARSVYERTCFPLEIATSQGARSMGHCSDFVQYIYFAGARLSDDYGEDAVLHHARQCPNSSFLHGEYPHHGLFKLQPRVHNYWMPNVEQVKKDQEALIPLTYQFLGKTHKSIEVIQYYLKGHSLPDTTRFMAHSSPDPLNLAARGIERNFNHFYHGYGHSGRKGTLELLKCWARNPSFPNITVLGQSNFRRFQNIININLITRRLDVDQVRTLQRSSGVHICSSTMEGYGHYINEARGVGALVVTTGFGPMNEFVFHDYSGVLIKPGRIAKERYQVFEHVGVKLQPRTICNSIQKVLGLSMHQRRVFGDRGRRLYELSRDAMQKNIRELKQEVVEHFTSKEENSMSQLDVDKVILECNRKLHDAQATIMGIPGTNEEEHA